MDSPLGGRASPGFASPQLPGSGLAELLQDVGDAPGGSGRAGLGAASQQRRTQALGVVEELSCKYRLHLQDTELPGGWGPCLAPGVPIAPLTGTRISSPVCTHVGHDELLEVAAGAGGVLLTEAQVDLVLWGWLPVAQVPAQLCNTTRGWDRPCSPIAVPQRMGPVMGTGPRG